jgi:hypothetical protein
VNIKKTALFVLVFTTLFPLFSQEVTSIDTGDIPDTIRNNRYYLESLRHTNLARLAMSEGEYDAVREYSDEAVRWAIRSDDFVRAFLENRKPRLPAQYEIRTWKGEKDCLWNIAAKSWAYNDPFKWKTLYEANKNKLPDPKNPNWLEPGIVLDIPAVKGESRQGIWSEKKTYEKFQ